MATRCLPAADFGNYHPDRLSFGDADTWQGSPRAILSGPAQPNSSPFAYRKRDGHAEPHPYADTDRNGDINRNANLDVHFNNYAHQNFDADYYTNSDFNCDIYSQFNINITAYYFP